MTRITARRSPVGMERSHAAADREMTTIIDGFSKMIKIIDGVGTMIEVNYGVGKIIEIS